MAPGELIHANKTPGMLLRFAMRSLAITTV